MGMGIDTGATGGVPTTPAFVVRRCNVQGRRTFGAFLIRRGTLRDKPECTGETPEIVRHIMHLRMECRYVERVEDAAQSGGG